MFKLCSLSSLNRTIPINSDENAALRVNFQCEILKISCAYNLTTSLQICTNDNLEIKG